MKFKSVIIILIICLVPSIVQGFFLKRPDHHEDPHETRFDIFLQELVKFKIRLIKNIIYPILVEIPWQKLFEPEKYFQERVKKNRSHISFDEAPKVQVEEPPSFIRNSFPTDDMIRLSMPPEDEVYQSSEEFDEVELLKVIPEIVEQMREGRVTHEEKVMMHSVYGELWPLIVEEAKRDAHQRAMNPILRAIFNSRELQMTTVARTRRAASNDVFWNSLNTIDMDPKTNMRQKRHDPSTESYTRLMDTVAILVRESLRGSLRSPKKELQRKRLQKKQRKYQKHKEQIQMEFFVPKMQNQ